MRDEPWEAYSKLTTSTKCQKCKLESSYNFSFFKFVSTSQENVHAVEQHIPGLLLKNNQKLFSMWINSL